MLKRRAGKMHTSSELTEVELAFLRDAPLPQDADFDDDSAYWSMGRDDGTIFRPDRPSVREMWSAMGADIVAEWAQERPGSRPSCWWRYEATEPRHRLGGRGEPSWPDRLHRGLPTGWSWPHVAHGGTFTGGPPQCDPNDPPVFESESSYLQRFGLLQDGELERLTAQDFEPKPIKVPRSVFRQ